MGPGLSPTNLSPFPSGQAASPLHKVGLAGARARGPCCSLSKATGLRLTLPHKPQNLSSAVSRPLGLSAGAGKAVGCLQLRKRSRPAQTSEPAEPGACGSHTPQTRGACGAPGPVLATQLHDLGGHPPAHLRP